MNQLLFSFKCLIFPVFLFLAACGGGSGGEGSGSESESTGQTGQFIDSPVENLDYESVDRSGSVTFSGKTDANGTYNYFPGDTVTFSFNGMTLGSLPASGLITPFDFDHNLLNVALFLQSMDTDSNNDNGITLSASPSSSTPANYLPSKLDEVRSIIDGYGNTPKNLFDVSQHLGNYLSDTIPAFANGRYLSTTFYSFAADPEGAFVQNSIATVSNQKVGKFSDLQTCPVEFTTGEINITDQSIDFTVLGANSFVHQFSIPRQGGNIYATATNSDLFAQLLKPDRRPTQIYALPEFRDVMPRPPATYEALNLQLRRPDSDCFTVIRFDRENGTLSPPYGGIRVGSGLDSRRPDGIKYPNPYVISIPRIVVPAYEIVALSNDKLFRDYEVEFVVHDIDGWITAATLEWEQGSNSGTIDLLTETADLMHWTEGYGHALETTDILADPSDPFSGVLSESGGSWWSGYGPFQEYASSDGTTGTGFNQGDRSTTVGVEHYLNSESNPHSLQGLTFIKNIEMKESIVAECNRRIRRWPEEQVTIRLKVIDNDNLQYNTSYVIEGDLSTGPEGCTDGNVDDSNVCENCTPPQGSFTLSPDSPPFEFVYNNEFGLNHCEYQNVTVSGTVSGLSIDGSVEFTSFVFNPSFPGETDGCPLTFSVSFSDQLGGDDEIGYSFNITYDKNNPNFEGSSSCNFYASGNEVNEVECLGDMRFSTGDKPFNAG